MYDRWQYSRKLKGNKWTGKILAEVEEDQDDTTYDKIKRARAKVWLIYGMISSLVIEDAPMLALNINISFFGETASPTQFAIFVLTLSCVSCVYKIFFALQLFAMKTKIKAFENEIDTTLQVHFGREKRRMSVSLEDDLERAAFYAFKNTITTSGENSRLDDFILVDERTKKMFLRGRSFVRKYLGDENFGEKPFFTDLPVNANALGSFTIVTECLRSLYKIRFNKQTFKNRKALKLMKENTRSFHDMAFIGSTIMHYLDSHSESNKASVVRALNNWGKEDSKMKNGHFVKRSDVALALLAHKAKSRFRRFQRLKTSGAYTTQKSASSVSDENLLKRLGPVIFYLGSLDRAKLESKWGWDQSWVSF